MSKLRKEEVVNAILFRLQKDLNDFVDLTNQLNTSVNESEKPKEDHHETTKDELGLLVQGYSKKIAEMQKNIDDLSDSDIFREKKQVSLGSLVELSVDNNRQIVLILPVGVVNNVQVADCKVIIMSVEGLFFAHIDGKRVGDKPQFNGRKIEILSVE